MSGFTIGLLAAVLLIPFFILVVYLMKLLPGEFSLASVGIMIIGDGVIAVAWKNLATSFTDDSVGLGLSCAFLIATIFKVVYMVLNPVTRELLNLK